VEGLAIFGLDQKEVAKEIKINELRPRSRGSRVLANIKEAILESLDLAKSNNPSLKVRELSV